MDWLGEIDRKLELVGVTQHELRNSCFCLFIRFLFEKTGSCVAHQQELHQLEIDRKPWCLPSDRVYFMADPMKMGGIYRGLMMIDDG